ncbi:MAG: response regulator transcription factor [Bacteroidia bacterium]|nr:response regulator transcription factor [Bacteroidia bacterium]MBP9689252.1 response regulator transcription factor [Bacteroidia bacterium]
MISLILIEDDLNIQEALVTYLKSQVEFNLIGAFSSFKAFNAATIKSNPNVFLLDINLPEVSGIEIIPIVKQRYPDAAILMLSVNFDNESVFKSMQAGADGYLSKETPLTKIKDAIIDLNNGGSPITPAIARKVFDFFNNRTNNITEDLSEREKAVVDGIVAGLSYKLIADEMSLSIDTIRKHIKSVYRKLHINSKGELIARYHGKG